MVEIVNYLQGVAMKQVVNPEMYLSLISFLMLMKQHVIAIGTEYELTAMQSLTLIVITNTEPRAMNSLASTFGCDASNITGIVDGLEQKGLLVRTESKADRRKKVIMLTAKGIAVREKIFGELADKHNLIFSNLDEQDMHNLERIVQKITIPCPNAPKQD